VKWQYAAALLGAGLYAADQIDINTARQLNMTTSLPADSKSVRIVNWNIDHGSHLETIAAELLKEPADLCLFQEVDWNANRSGNQDIAGELARRLHLNMAYAIEFEELSQARGHSAYIGQATLSRYPIRRSRVFRFARQSGFWKPHAWIPSNLPLMQRRLGNRVALVTDLELNGKLLAVYNLHLESRSMGLIQTAQLDEILADLKSYPAGAAAIIGGDINSKYFPSVFLHKLEREGFRSALGERIERTHVIAMALDWIFVRGPFEWSGGVVRRDLKGSDHYPIYATLNIK
jgi:endonuclease/exonuclease/phosphatase family metal-dependent hydrolase